MRSTRMLVSSALLAILAACGGDDGSAPPIAQLVAITPGNQTTVARAAVSGGLAVTISQPLAAPGRAAALSADTARAAPAALVQAVTWRALAPAVVLRRSVAAARAHPLAVSSESEACGLSGSLVTTTDDRDGNGDYSPGDVLTVVFAQCRDTASDLINGTVVFTIASVPSDAEFAGNMVFQNVSAAFGVTSGTVSGGADVSVLLTEETLQITLVAGTGGLSANVSSPGYSDTIVYDPGMRFTMRETPTAVLVTFDGSFTATSVGGGISLTTPQELRQLDSDDYPSSGQILASGDLGSKLRITVIDKTQVRLELDANGDGIFEGNQVMLWSSLLPQ